MPTMVSVGKQVNVSCQFAIEMCTYSVKKMVVKHPRFWHIYLVILAAIAQSTPPTLVRRSLIVPCEKSLLYYFKREGYFKPDARIKTL